MQSSVPKFGSFKPKPAAPKEEQARARPEAQVEQRRPRHEVHGRHKSRGKDSSVAGRADGSSSSRSLVSESKFRHGYTEELFKVDSTGDDDNRRYGANSRWQVPTYREPTERYLVGGDREWKGRQGGSLLGKLSHEDRARLMREGRFVGSVKSSSSTVAENQQALEFISISGPSKRRRLTRDLSVLGLALSNEAAAEAEDLSSDASDGAEEDDIGKPEEDSDRAQLLRLQLQHVQDKVKSNPGDTTAWLEYVRFQEQWVREGLSTDAPASHSETKSTTAKLQLSIINDGLKAVGANKDKWQILALRRLEIGQLMWSNDHLEQEWQVVLRQSARSLAVLESFLSYRRSSKSNAKGDAWEVVRNLYAEILGLISNIEKSDPRRGAKLAQHTIGVTSFFRDTGYTELAVAIWQTLIHAHGLSKTSEKTPQQLDHVVLEAWWKSETARAGEQGLQNSQVSPRSPPDRHPVQQEDEYDRWAYTELERMRQCQLPARTLDIGDDDADDDTFRIVLYHEVQPFIFQWHNTEAVLDAFLVFCGLPRLPKVDDADIDLVVHEWCPLDGDERPTTTTQEASFMLPSQSWLTTTETMFAAAERSYQSFGKVCSTDTYARLAANALEKHVGESVKTSPQDGEVVEYFLALTLQLSPAAARKTVKALLDGGKTQCVRLYLCLALIEAKLKGEDAASRIFVLAINLCASKSVVPTLECLKLWNSWAWQALTHRRPNVALGRIVSIGLAGTTVELVKAQRPSQADVLRAREQLQAIRDDALSNRDWPMALQAVELLVTLAHLATLSIPRTAETFSTSMTLVQAYVSPTSSLAVGVHQHFARLMHAHVTTRLAPFSPRDLAAALAPSLLALPGNGLVLGTYAELLAHGSRLDDRVRSAARQILHVGHQGSDGEVRPGSRADGAVENNQLMPHLFAIQGELGRATELGGTAASVRAVCERAVSDPGCAHSETVWALYLGFESALLRRLQDQATAGLAASVQAKGSSRRRSELAAARDRVKGIFYRGQAALPWSKGWVMRAFAAAGAGRSWLDGSVEKRALVEGMDERCFRLHNGVDV